MLNSLKKSYDNTNQTGATHTGKLGASISSYTDHWSRCNLLMIQTFEFNHKNVHVICALVVTLRK